MNFHWRINFFFERGNIPSLRQEFIIYINFLYSSLTRWIVWWHFRTMFLAPILCPWLQNYWIFLSGTSSSDIAIILPSPLLRGHHFSGRRYESSRGHAFIVGRISKRTIGMVLYSKTFQKCDDVDKRGEEAEKYDCPTSRKALKLCRMVKF